MLTGAGNLPFRAIIHVAAINMAWRASENSIKESVRSAMKIVGAKGFTSVAFPVLGTGSGGFPHDRALAVMQSELASMAIDISVRIVIYDPKSS